MTILYDKNIHYTEADFEDVQVHYDVKGEYVNIRNNKVPIVRHFLFCEIDFKIQISIYCK